MKEPNCIMDICGVGVVCSYINLNIFLISDRSQPTITMNPLEPPTKEELAQELLDFKHLEGYPASFEEMPFRVREITDNCLHQQQLYDNTVERMRLTRKYMNDLQEFKARQEQKPQLFKYLQMSLLHRDVQEAVHMLYAENTQERYKFLASTKKLNKEMFTQVSKDIKAFGELKEKAQAAGETYKYSAILEEEMQKIALSKFEKADEAIFSIGKGLNSEDWWS